MNGKGDARVVVLAHLNNIETEGGRACFAAELRRAVAPPDRLFGLTVRDHVLMTVVEQDFAAFGRLGDDDLLLAELFAAEDHRLRQFFCEIDTGSEISVEN